MKHIHIDRLELKLWPCFFGSINQNKGTVPLQYKSDNLFFKKSVDFALGIIGVNWRDWSN